jgi:hypothetical protein
VLNPIEPPWYVTRMPGGVRGAEPQGSPLSRSMLRSINVFALVPVDTTSASALISASSSPANVAAATI